MDIKPYRLAEPIFMVALVAAPTLVNAAGNETHAAQNLTSSERASTTKLAQLINVALSNDGNRKQYSAQSAAMRETGVASSTLMDPKLKVGFGGLPVDSFKFDEDPMTNISVGLMQQFERGSTLDLQQKKANQQADGLGLQVNARELEVANSMTQLWLELGYQQRAEQIMLENRKLMKEMENFIQTNYSIGKSEAQDLLNAQLQVSKLDEKLQANAQMQRRLISQLSEWLGSDWLANEQALHASNQLNWNTLNNKLASSIDYKADQSVIAAEVWLTGDITMLMADFGMITLNHLPVAEWSWDAGEMSFSVGEEVDLSGFEEGQKVRFLVEKQGADYVLKQLEAVEG
ncbi:TolC family protein [Vibrio campbellii]|uniref:TolC family protein n=2 Tax=Vibrio campbellii TaxID=680 RepID=A0AAE9SLQ1_9VIBR|nr:TolC family protein [Vibrio campbellii]